MRYLSICCLVFLPLPTFFVFLLCFGFYTILSGYISYFPLEGWFIFPLTGSCWRRYWPTLFVFRITISWGCSCCIDHFCSYGCFDWYLMLDKRYRDFWLVKVILRYFICWIVYSFIDHSTSISEEGGYLVWLDMRVHSIFSVLVLASLL